MLVDHTSLNITFPVLTLLFFDTQSHLFAPDASHSVRSMWYGLCVAIPHIVNIVMTPFLSVMSDVFGRKKILLIGTVGAFLFALTTALGILWGLLSLVLLGRVIQGAFSRTNPIAQAVIGDISPKDKKVRNMGYLQAAISIGACIGPIIGGFFARRFFFSQLNFSLPYFIAAAFAGVGCVLTVMIFQETLLKSPSIPLFQRGTFFVKSDVMMGSFRGLKKLFGDPQVILISLILLLSQMSWGLYYQFIPPILKTTLGFAADTLGLFVGIIALWLALATSFGIKLLDGIFSLKQMLLFSLYLVLAGLLMSALCALFHLTGHTAVMIWLAAVPTAMGDVIAYSCLITFYSNVVPEDDQGKVMGICFIVVALMWSLTGLLGGVMMSFYELLPLFVAPVGVVLAIVLLHGQVAEKLK